MTSRHRRSANRLPADHGWVNVRQCREGIAQLLDLLSRTIAAGRTVHWTLYRTAAGNHLLRGARKMENGPRCNLALRSAPERGGHSPPSACRAQRLRFCFRGLPAMLLALACAATVPQVHAQATVQYVHTDALGTPVAVTDSNGNIIERQLTTPYGELPDGAANDQIAFAGHVVDSRTELTYMQQRYYDAHVGRFLSVDPVTAHENPAGAMNRYWYANNNPYAFKDPDGRVVQYVFTDGVTKRSGMMHMAAMSMSQIARNELRQLEESKHTYTIIISNTKSPTYDADTRRVWLNPTKGLRIASTGEIQTPDVNSAHEISHPAEHDRLGDDYGEALRTIEKNGVSKEENRASALEREVGKELGKPTRQYYRDVTREAVKCNPENTTGC